MDGKRWFGARCVFKDDDLYEERITLWKATSFEDAIVQAEAEAYEYAEDVEITYLEFVQVYELADEVRAGAEVFSLMRTSDLGPTEYLDAHFDTGTEFQGRNDER